MAKNFHQTPFDKALQLFSSIKRAVFKQSGVCPEDYFYVMPVNAFGELVFTLAQSHHLRKQGKVCLLIKNDRNFLLEFWPQAADFVIFLTQQEYDLLFHLESISFRSPGWFFLCWADLFGDGRFGLDLVLRNHKLTIKEMYSYALGLDLTVPILPPQVAGNKNAEGGKTVLFIQHARTYSRIPAPFWAALAKEFNRRGYTIYVDQVAEQDRLCEPVADVHYLNKSVRDLVEFANSMDLVIALRSGLADLLGACSVGSSLRLIVLYHITNTFNGTQREFHHTAGVAGTGLNLSKCFTTDLISDLEIVSDDPARLADHEVQKVMDRVNSVVV